MRVNHESNSGDESDTAMIAMMRATAMIRERERERVVIRVISDNESDSHDASGGDDESL